MTDDELKFAECREFGPEGNETVAVLVAEVRRLRALIKDAEWFSGVGEYDSEYGCPWCKSDGFYKFGKLGHGKHAPECPAFHEDGSVR
jgi:hypothetical protein